jgi:hypothetical protein
MRLPFPLTTLTLSPKRMKNMSSKSTEQTLQLPGLSPTQIQNPIAAVEEAVEEAVAVDVADAEAADVARGSRNKTFHPLTRRHLAMLAPKGNDPLNLMEAHTPE